MNSQRELDEFYITIEPVHKLQNNEIEKLKTSIDFGHAENTDKLLKEANGTLTAESRQKVLDSKFSEAEVKNIESQIANLEEKISLERIRIFENKIPLHKTLAQYPEQYRNCTTVEKLI